MNQLLSPFVKLRDFHGRHELLLLLVTAVFVGSNAVALSLARTGTIAWSYLWATAVWLAIIGAAFGLLTHYQPRHDRYLLPIFALLTGWGGVLLQRLAPNFLARQTVWLFVGTAVLLAVAILPRSLRILRRYRYTLLITGLLLLLATFLLGVNPSGYGAALWLPLPFWGNVYFQPSELLKLLLVIFLASYFDERESLLRLDGHHGRWGPLPYLAPLLLMWGFCLLLLIWQRDLGAATLFFILFLALLYVAIGDWRYLVGGLSLLLIGSIFAYFAFDVVALRVDAWWNPWPEFDNRAFQIVQSLYAVAAGGLFGQGVGQGFPVYIPVVHSDFAFAAIAEEWGFVGAFSVVMCYLLLAFRGMKIAAQSIRPFHRYLAIGITMLFTAQSLLIMGGVTKLLPLTGVTLPFLSYGGSSMLISCLMVSLLFYLSSTQDSTHVPYNAAVQKRQQYLMLAVAGAYLLLVCSLLYWNIFRAETILSREDNPRLVEAELRIRRGQILDRSGTVLAETIINNGRLQRIYPVPNSGHAVGYYSFRHGTSGVEEQFNTVLRGDPDDEWQQLANEWLHQPQTGYNVQLSLDARLQQVAASLLGQQQGGVLLLEIETGHILALVSHPSYDANQLDAHFDALVADAQAPLLNRIAQGQYQPGLLLQPFLMTTAVEQGLIRLDDAVLHPNRAVAINGQTLQCRAPAPEPATWVDVLAYQCPGPMQDLGQQLGLEGLSDALTLFDLTAVPDLPLNTQTPALNPMRDPLLAGIGQENLLITPLQLGLAWAALVSDGRLPVPQLVTAVQNNEGQWQPLAPETDPISVLSPQLVLQIRQLLSDNGRVEFSSQVLSGPEGNTNSWYLGAIPANQPRYVVVVVVENSQNETAAKNIGGGLLSTAVNNQ